MLRSSGAMETSMSIWPAELVLADARTGGLSSPLVPQVMSWVLQNA